jgi:hypothetical protein
MGTVTVAQVFARSAGEADANPTAGLANVPSVPIEQDVRVRSPRPSFFWSAAVAVAMFAAIASFAADPRPVVGPGATKDDVINAYGWPNGQSQSGTKEILSYAQGEVVLENGRVEKVDFSPNVPWQPPKPRPPPPSPTTRKTSEAPVDFWVLDFDSAAREALRRHARILALFTGSDWSPASKRFHDEVEFHPDFVNAFTGDFVFLKLDFPRGSPVPAKIDPKSAELRVLYDVTTYPTLLILAPNGDLLGRVDLAKPQPGDSFRGRVIAAIREAKAQLGEVAASQPGTASEMPAAPVVPDVTAPTTAVPQSAPPAAAEPMSARPSSNASSSAESVQGSPAAEAVWTAGRVVIGAIVAGAVLVALLLWWLWRNRVAAEGTSPLAMKARIDAAAGGLPTYAEMSGWTKQKLCAITAGLAESDDYAVEVRPADDDVDLALRKRGDLKPRVLVCCAPGADGVTGAKRLRELFGTMTAEGVDTGWFVSPAGFASEARQYAEAHRIILIANDTLHNLMREVPPVSLPRLLARQ